MKHSDWTCPECSYVNAGSLIRCACGYENLEEHYGDTPSVGKDTSFRKKGDPEAILEILNEGDIRNESWLKNLSALIISIVVFFLAGVAAWKTEYLGLLVVAIFIHEGGHVLAMKFFGFKNVQMLFIPLVGVVTAGKTSGEGAAVGAAITLFGPFVGIMSAVVAGVIFNVSGIEYFRTYVIVAILINILNLLPIYPLDGGRFFNYLVFSRFPRAEIVFRIVAATLITLAALKLSDLILLFLGIIVAVRISTNMAISRVAESFKQQYGTHKKPDRETVEFLQEKLLREMPSLSKTGNIHKAIARQIKIILGKVNHIPASFKEIVILLIFYIVTFIALPVFALLRVT